MYIYLIVNHVTGKLYIGQHKGNNLKKYLQQKFGQSKYELKRKGHGSGSYLFNSMRKHLNQSDWSIHSIFSDIETKAELDQLEKDLIKALRATDPEIGYNICRGGEGFTGPHSEKSKQKTSQALKRMGHKPTSEATAKSITVRQEIQKESGSWPGVQLVNMMGTTVNGIVILKQLESTKDGDAVWSCRCVCGESFTALGGSLRSGHTRSCGCLKIVQDRANLAGGSKTKDLAGKIINGVRVLERAGSLKRLSGRMRDTLWSCVCHCGDAFIGRGRYLRTGHTKSCGCLRGRKQALSL